MMGLASERRMTPRELQCISMVARHIPPKQIARELGISENTVRGYLRECVQILGASDLRHAARLFSEASATNPHFLGGETNSDKPDDYQDAEGEGQFFGTQNSWVSEEAAGWPDIASAGHNGTVQLIEGEKETPKHQAITFHFFRGQRAGNDLGKLQRMVWILSVTLVLMVLFGFSIIILDGILVIAKSLN